MTFEINDGLGKTDEKLRYDLIGMAVAGIVALVGCYTMGYKAGFKESREKILRSLKSRAETALESTRYTANDPAAQRAFYELHRDIRTAIYFLEDDRERLAWNVEQEVLEWQKKFQKK